MLQIDTYLGCLILFNNVILEKRRAAWIIDVAVEKQLICSFILVDGQNLKQMCHQANELYLHLIKIECKKICRFRVDEIDIECWSNWYHVLSVQVQQGSQTKIDYLIYWCLYRWFYGSSTDTAPALSRQSYLGATKFHRLPIWNFFSNIL